MPCKFMKEKQHITIRIADEQLPMDIPPAKEEDFRNIEKEVNYLYSSWRKEYGDRFSSRQVLAMVAFRFAQAFYELQMKTKARQAALEDADKALSRLLLDVK